MKRLIAILLVLCGLMTCAALAEDAPTRVIALKGPTGMGLVKMMKDAADDPAYAFSLAGSADEIVPLLARQEIDIAAVPANLASVLYNATQGGVRAIAVNTLGVLYIVERGDTVHAVADLAGRTVYSAGRGASPEYALDYILRANGMDPEKDVTIEYRGEHAECLAALLADESAVAVLPQPFVTVAAGKAADLRVALDLTREWDSARGDRDGAMLTGVYVARAAFIDEHPELIADFLEKYAASVDYVNENTDQAAALVAEYGIVAEAVARAALPACNIVCVTGEPMRAMLSGYLAVLAERSPAAVGGALPDEAFYHVP